MNDIKSLQGRIKELVDKINSKHKHSCPDLISFMKVVEELGEITEILLRTHIKSRKHDKLSKEKVKEEMGSEIADCIIAVLSLANDFDVDISEFLEKKLKKHEERCTQY